MQASIFSLRATNFTSVNGSFSRDEDLAIKVMLMLVGVTQCRIVTPSISNVCTQPG